MRVSWKNATQLFEPFEKVEVNVPDEYVGSVVDLLSKRKGRSTLENVCVSDTMFYDRILRQRSVKDQ